MQYNNDVIRELAMLPGRVPMLTPDGSPIGEDIPVNIDPMQQPLWDIDEAFLNPFEPVKAVPTWAMMGDRPAFPCQGLISIDAKPKQGKSYCAYAAMVALLSGESFGGIAPLAMPNMVIVFDTEMSSISLTPRYKAIREAIGNNANRFLIVPLMRVKKSERWATIERITATYNPNIIIIDHISKLVTDINSHAEAGEVSERLTALKADRSVFVIIHQNKGADNTNMRGSIGSIIDDDQCESYTAVRKNGIFTLQPKSARDTDTSNATPFQFAIDINGCIITADSVIERNKEKEREQLYKDLQLIFGDAVSLSYQELRNRIMTHQVLKQTAAENVINKAKVAGAIAKLNPTDRNSPYVLVSGVSEEIL